jgi:hypothetical protein
VALPTRSLVEYASPYGAPEELATAARRLAGLDVDLVAMDCIGYTLAMKETVRSRLDRSSARIDASRRLLPSTWSRAFDLHRAWKE